MLSLQTSASFSLGKPLEVTLRNFYEPEDGFVWSTGKWCEMVFDFMLPPPRGKMPVDVMLDLDVFKADEAPTQDVLVYLNGLRIGSFNVEARKMLVSTVDVSSLKPTGNILTIDTPTSASPKQFGQPDDRVLGVQLFSLQLRSAA